ncbi:hypothetical protein C1I99_01825 [Micromonospora deserti]|uniref:Uncharacterized protein n=1 Tax=Micromonospora deserti TaxID=2070366 RepID=A0A2W2CSP2_9ACTN|nr:hypothetical protein C1I99_01825 [Micromonospora deserti]
MFEPPAGVLGPRAASFDAVGGMQTHTGELTRALDGLGVAQTVVTTRSTNGTTAPSPPAPSGWRPGRESSGCTTPAAPVTPSTWRPPSRRQPPDRCRHLPSRLAVPIALGRGVPDEVGLGAEPESAAGLTSQRRTWNGRWERADYAPDMDGFST